MKRSVAAVAVTAALIAASSAQACAIRTELQLEDARDADVIVAARVKRFKPEPTDTWDGRPAPYRPATLTLEVEDAIVGQVPQFLTVEWRHGINHGPPEAIRGSYLIALRQVPQSNAAAAGGYEVMQVVCSGSFVFQRGSGPANAIRAMYGLPPEPLVPIPKSFAERLGYRPVPWPTLVGYGFVGFSIVLIGAIVLWPRRRQRRFDRDDEDADLSGAP